MSLNIARVRSIPAEPSPDTIYLVGKADDDRLTIAAVSSLDYSLFILDRFVSFSELTTLLNTKVDVVSGKDLVDVDFTNDLSMKLGSVEAGATKNLPDASLVARSSHTGTQAMSTIQDLATLLNAKVKKVVGKDLSENNFTNEFANKLAGIQDQATKNQSDAWLLNRANHTGSQTMSTIDGLETVINSKVDVVPGKDLTDVDFTTEFATKLAGIEAGATKNSTDAQLLDRATHTGQQPVSTITSLETSLQSKAKYVHGRFTTSSTELTAAMNDRPDQQQIFSTWERLSHNNSGVYPAIPAEIDTWAFNAALGLVENTSNSSGLVAVVSQKAYDNYKLRVRINSTNADDDFIGVLIAFHRTPDGKEHTLIAHRTPGGSSFLWAVSYNIFQGTGMNQFSVNGSSTVTWGNNAPGSLTKAEAAYINNQPGWGNMGAFQGNDGGLLIQVERKGDIIEATTSQWATPTVLDPATKITIDLSTNPLLNKFQGPKPYGFAAHSQDRSSWITEEFTNPQDAIVDLIQGKAYSYVNGQWAVNATIPTSFEEGTFLIDEVSGQVILSQNKGRSFAVFQGSVI